jgi:peptide/nickel transport system permease protein
MQSPIDVIDRPMMESGASEAAREIRAPRTESGGEEGAREIKAPRSSQIISRHFFSNRLAVLGLILSVTLIALAIIGPLVAPHDPIKQHESGLTEVGAPLPPGGQFLMGTDRLGRDVASRLIYGARISLAIGILANGLAILIGVVVGALAGYAGRVAETVLMRLTDVMMAFPLILLLIALAVILQPSFTTIILVIAIGGWTGTARLVRGQVLSIKERDFIVAARVVGASRWDILRRHILPHLVPQIITWFTLGIAPIILIESALSYLGVGVQPPQPSWGNMIAEGQVVMAYAPWLILFPSVALILTVIAFNLVGDGLRDALFAGGRRA